MNMEKGNRGSWKMVATVLPLLVVGVSTGCSDDNDGPAGTGRPPVTGGSGGRTTGEVTVSADVSTSTTWDRPVYILKQKIFVTSNAVLTIAPGTQVLGDAAASEKAALIVTRGARLMARGTRDKPIIFGSSNPVGSRVAGDWAGVALNGNARINGGSPCASGAADCREGNLEGLPTSDARGLFGGTDDASSCGEMEYARVEFAGAIFTEGKELNGLTLAGCGSGTKISYVQIHRGKDDGVEFFGGTAGVDHLVISGAEDDNLDWDFGWTGTAQFVVIHQYNHPEADNGFEASNNMANEAATPVSSPKISNVTMFSEGGPRSRAIHFKEGTRGKFTNLIVQGFKSDVVNFTAKTATLSSVWPANLSVEYSYFFDNGSYKNEDTTDDDMMFNDQMAVEDPARNNKKDVDPHLTSLDQANPSFVPRNAGMTGVAPDFGDTSATYPGAIKPNEPSPWTAGWTAYPVD
jgi:hypothetical protein